MAGKATPVILTEQEQNELEVWGRKPTMERRFAARAHIVLEAATEKTTQDIALSLKVRRGMVSKWRVRFARQHMDGLMDKPRRGAKVKYGEDMERRILTQLDVPPPPGYTTWTGGLDTGLPFVSCDKVDTALAEAASKKCVSYRHPGARGYQTITADTGNDSRYSWRIREHQQNVQKGK